MASEVRGADRNDVLQDPRTIVALLMVGLVLRVMWLCFGTTHWLSIGEALNVARAITESGVIGDAFRPGQGATAHVMPIPPLIAGGIYKMLGFQSIAAEAVLTAWSLLLIGISFWYFNLTFKLLRSPPLARVAAVAFLSIVPLNFALEAVWFRVWDGGLAVAAAAVFLYVIVAADGKPVTAARTLGLAFLLALLFFIQPNFGVGGILCSALFMVRNIAPRRWPATAAAALLAAVIVFAPWTIRNAREMGSPIVLRSNFGLEMALAFYPEAITARDQRQAYFARHQAIHPYENGGGYAAMQRAGGEVLYAKQLGAETFAWMAAHPASAARLALRHLVQTLFPPRWYWTMFADTGAGNGAKMAINWIVSALGLIGIINAVIRLDRRYRYPAIMTCATILPFMLVQPTLRYRYLIFALLVFFAADVVVRLYGRLTARSSTGWVSADP